ncbi:MAG: hypothetical protein ACRC10_07745 [Thermoguttaceae bacterium]
MSKPFLFLLNSKVAFVLPILFCLTILTSPATVQSESALLHESYTYPRALHEDIDAYINSHNIDTIPENSAAPSNIPALLRQVVLIFHEIDSRLYTDPRQIKPYLRQVEKLSQRLDSSDLVLKGIRAGIERRIALWTVIAETRYSFRNLFEEDQLMIILQPRTITDYNRLIEQTKVGQNFFDEWNDPESSQVWKSFLELPAFTTLKEYCDSALLEQQSNPDSYLPEEICLEFCRLANIIACQMTDSTFTEKQTAFLNREPIRSWREELEKWTDDTVHPLYMLAMIEQYESNRSPEDGAATAQLAYQLSVCKSQKLRELADVVRFYFGKPNIKVCVSETLMNYLLPTRDPEFDRFRDIVVGEQIIGKRRTDTIVRVGLNPDPKHLNISLLISGFVNATGTSERATAKIESQTYATYYCKKELCWTDKGIVVSPAHVTVNNKTQLRSVKTGLDGLPLFSNLAREIAQGQFYSKEGQINAETKEKISATVRDRVNREVRERLTEFNENYHNRLLIPLNNAGLTLKQTDAATTENWIYSAWRLISDASLSSHTPEPETIYGAYADLKIHETAIQTLIRSLELDGRTISVGELKKLIAEKTGRTSSEEILEENDNVVLSFAEDDPVLIRLNNNRAEVILTFTSMKVNRTTYRNFRSIVNYYLTSDENGEPILARETSLKVIAPLSPKSQIGIRAVISKIFPPNKTYSLVPAVLKTDDRFAELTTGLTRLENGWFAIAIVAKEPTLSEDTTEPSENKTVQKVKP